MSKLIYPSSQKIEGPWLLDKNSLEKFESMVNDIVLVLRADSGEEYKPKYTIVFSDGKSIVEQSLLDFNIKNEINNALPKKLVVSISTDTFVSSVYCTELIFKLNQRNLQSFEYNIRGISDETSKLMIINKIKDWVEENQPSRFLRIWNKIYWLSAFLCCVTIYMTSIAFGLYNNTNQLYQNSLLPQLQSLLEQGIDESNFTTALELLLIKEYSYVPSSFEAKSDPKIWVFLISIFAIIAVVGFCCPKANIAIGAGKKRVKFWKAYERLITVTIPTLILLPVFLNFVSSFF